MLELLLNVLDLDNKKTGVASFPDSSLCFSWVERCQRSRSKDRLHSRMVNLRRSTSQRENVRRDVDTVAKKNCPSESDNSCKARNILKLNRWDLPSSILPENLRRRAHRLALKKKRGNDGTGIVIVVRLNGSQQQ